MTEIRYCEDLDECRSIWNSHWPPESLFDLWEVRNCFQESFQRPPLFLVAEESGRPAGFLALSWIEENGHYANFPGETWKGRTWLEQNRIPATDTSVVLELLANVPAACHLRYLESSLTESCAQYLEHDENGYLFFPATHNYSIVNYWQNFPGKKRRKLAREIELVSQPGLQYRFDELEDIEEMFKMNLTAFGENSYFGHQRFSDSFARLIRLLHDRKMLRVTAVLLGGKIAAVDVGAVYNDKYSVLAGGTCHDFPGVAKLINIHHLDRSCREKLESVDFLCGDFGWKERFQLTARPLYKLEAPVAANIFAASGDYCANF